MGESPPRVSIGVPVYNGESYLRQALDSLLAQTFTDLEIVIADNHSTDGTEAICREYAERDPRIRYTRNETNLGMTANFRRVFELARAPYFKWAHYDDICAPELVERAVAVLDRHPSVVLAFGRTQVIDEHGVVIGRHPHDGLTIDSPRPDVRFNELIRVYHWCVQQFGVMRSDVLRETHLYGSFPQPDRVFMAELALRGRLHVIPEDLFFFRSHQQDSMRLSSTLHRLAWLLDPAKEGKVVFPTWRLFQEWWRVVAKAPLSRTQRVRCYLHLLRWPMRGLNAARLARDVVWAATFTARRLAGRSRVPPRAQP